MKAAAGIKFNTLNVHGSQWGNRSVVCKRSARALQRVKAGAAGAEKCGQGREVREAVVWQWHARNSAAYAKAANGAWLNNANGHQSARPPSITPISIKPVRHESAAVHQHEAWRVRLVQQVQRCHIPSRDTPRVREVCVPPCEIVVGWYL